MKDTLIDNQGRTIGHVEVEEIESHRFSGSINTADGLEALLAVFKEYAQLIDQENLTDADLLEKRIESFGCRLEKADAAVRDLRVIGDQVSFEVVQVGA